VVDESIGAGPINIVVDRGVLPSVDGLVVRERSLFLGGRWHPLRDEHVYHSRLDVADLGMTALRRGAAALQRIVVDAAPSKSLAFLLDERRVRDLRPGFEHAVADRIAWGVRRILAGDLVGGVRAVKGCGFGLTPSGDDFLCGLLVGMNLLGRAGAVDVSDRTGRVFGAARSGRVLTDTFLSLARDGCVSEGVKALVCAMGDADNVDIEPATKRLLSVGATSGADFAVGLVTTVLGSTRDVRDGEGAYVWS
jgi:hypothetical protein